jgi:membrane-associated phospholipid phosphatase
MKQGNNNRKERKALVKFGAVLGVMMLSLFFIEKGDMVLWFNHHYSEPGDFFMKSFTLLGDGILFVPFLLITLFISYRHAIASAITGLLLTSFVNLMKGTFFHDEPRPREFFKFLDPPLKLVEGVDVHLLHTFPSGHAATAAAILILISLFAKRDVVTWICLILAWLIGLTRVYLAQHFWMDVVFGHLFGCVAATLAVLITRKWLAGKKWADGRLARRPRKTNL